MIASCSYCHYGEEPERSVIRDDQPNVLTVPLLSKRRRADRVNHDTVPLQTSLRASLVPHGMHVEWNAGAFHQIVTRLVDAGDHFGSTAAGRAMIGQRPFTARRHTEADRQPLANLDQQWRRCLKGQCRRRSFGSDPRCAPGVCYLLTHTATRAINAQSSMLSATTSRIMERLRSGPPPLPYLAPSPCSMTFSVANAMLRSSSSERCWM